MADGSDLLLGPGGLAGFTVHTHREPNAGTRRLMEWLGVEIDVTVTAPIAICLVGGCEWRWDGEGDRSAVIEEHRLDEHDYIPRHRFSVRTSLNGVDGYDDGHADPHLPVLPVELTEPEPNAQQEVETVPTNSGRAWTRESVIDAIRRFHTENGRPPTQKDWVRSGDWWPSFSTAARPFGSWGAAVKAAGFTPSKPGGPKRSSVREPKASEAAVVLTGTSPAASSSSPLPESDAAVVGESPSALVVEQAGSRTDEYAEWLAATVDVERLEREADGFEARAFDCSRRARALRSIVAAARTFAVLDESES